jgi:1,4-alpha-glucan branching enzyme
MKGSMLNKMFGTAQQKFANLRALYAYMWAHPGKKLLFMGGEIGQWREWSEERSIDWHLLEGGGHAGIKTLVRDLNNLLRERPALYELDVEPRGFRWIDVDNALENVVAFMRLSNDGDTLVCVCNFSAAPRHGYRFGLPERGTYRLVLNTDSSYYTGGDALTIDSVEAEEQPWHHLPFSAAVDLPPLTTLWFEVRKPKAEANGQKTAEEKPEPDASAAASHAEAAGEAKTVEESRKAVAKKSRGARKTATKKTAKGASKRTPRKKKE